DTGRPLRRARITLSGPELGREGRSTSTNLDGRYEMADLPAGRYTIRVTRSGYLPLQYGQRRPLEPGKPLQLLDKQAIDRIDFALPRASVISGQITDELSEPVADVQVFAMRSTWFQGRRRMVPVGLPARTDDAGEYRLTGLSPGSYDVMATLRETWTVTENGVERMLGYAPTYAPGTASLTDARRVTVAVGQAVGNTNFALMPGTAASVSGMAADSLGAPLVSRGIILMQEFAGASGAIMSMGGNATTAADGSFTIKNVPPGSYKVLAQTTRDTQSVRGTVLEIATQPVTLDGADITNLSLTTSMGWSIAGTVIADTGAPPDAPPTRFGVAARLVDPDSGMGMGGAPPPPPPPGAPGGGAIPDSGRVRPDWSFTVVSVFGAARVRPFVPDGWTVKAILHDGRDIADAPIELKSGETLTDVQIVVSNRVTNVSGQLLDDKGAPLVDGTVIVFTDDAAKWMDDSRWVRAVRPDQQGRYQIQGLPPGDYLAVAVDYVEEGIWNDPEYLESIRRHGQRLTLSDAESKSLTLKPVTP
ncbi:MAG TPA: carboxypeptidase-like regulatory domain-containing protein, partial [Vicinamibacterales bacterium]|nr:carboxypeptidase-like regulatory domain-containing protein [Vicinamibacterales bacterium]